MKKAPPTQGIYIARLVSTHSTDSIPTSLLSDITSSSSRQHPHSVSQPGSTVTARKFPALPTFTSDLSKTQPTARVVQRYKSLSQGNLTSLNDSAANQSLNQLHSDPPRHVLRKRIRIELIKGQRSCLIVKQRFLGDFCDQACSKIIVILQFL